MIQKRRLMVAILAALCLTVTLFTVLPLKSSSTKSAATASTSSYDPWADANGDGTIDMYDIGYTASMFLATGDPTKDVNVTNWPTGLSSGNVNVTNWPSSMSTGNDIVANGYLTTMLDANGFLARPNSGITVTNSNEAQLGGANITLIGGDISGEATWHWIDSITQANLATGYASAGGSCQVTGRAVFYDSSDSLMAVLTVPINHEVSMRGVYRVRLVVNAVIPCAGGFSVSFEENYLAAATATIYWTQS